MPGHPCWVQRLWEWARDEAFPDHARSAPPGSLSSPPLQLLAEKVAIGDPQAFLWLSPWLETYFHGSASAPVSPCCCFQAWQFTAKPRPYLPGAE